MLRKAADLYKNSFWKTTFFRLLACWYLNESFLHEKSDYVIILIQGSTDISEFGTVRFNKWYLQHQSGLGCFEQKIVDLISCIVNHPYIAVMIVSAPGFAIY